MSRRMTMSEKWQDPWFRDLSPKSKLLFLWMCDACDWGGFGQVDVGRIVFEAGLKTAEITKAIPDLTDAVQYSDDGWFWLLDFCAVQKHLPLNKHNNAHLATMKALAAQRLRFPDVVELFPNDVEIEHLAPALPLTRGIGKGYGLGIGKGIGEEKASPMPPKKLPYGELKKVLLTADEYAKLEAKHGAHKLSIAIEILDTYIGSSPKGAKYTNHYAVLKSNSWVWDRVAEKQQSPSRAKQYANSKEPS